MAIKPIQGFYVHDEDTSSDGVGKYDYYALANKPELATDDTLAEFTVIKQGEVVKTYDVAALGWGWVRLDGTIRVDTDTLAYTDYIPVSVGDVITSNGNRALLRFVAAFDVNKTAQSSSGTESTYTYTVPSGIAYVRLTLYTDNANDITTFPSFTVKSIGDVHKIGVIDNVTEEKTVSFNKTVTAQNAAFGWINASGTERADEDGVLAYMDYIAVDEGDVVTSNGTTNTNIRFVAAYDELKRVKSSAGTDSYVASYTVPSGVAFIRPTVWVNTPQDLTTVPTINIAKSGTYVLPIVDDSFTSEVYPPPAKALASVAQDATKEKSITRRGSLASGDTWEFEENNISTGKVLSFSGTITAFSSLEIGHGRNESEANYVKIDGTNVYEYGGGSVINTYPHGLTIEDNIQLTITVKNENAYNAYLVLVSSGETFEQTMPRWYGDSGALFVKSVGSALSDCSFGWTCTNYRKPTFVFGDSYLGYATPNRWAYHLLHDGYEQYLDGYGGRRTPYAYLSFKLAISHATPKYVLWAMGMNDPDNNAVSSDWLNATQKMLDLCERNGITPILATIPNVAKSGRDNTYKNEWVRNSGYRYVDFASAVGGIEVGSSWYDGMLNSDELHPNEKGAIALYRQVLADFPEIAMTD